MERNRTHDWWDAWQRAAADYWVVRHSEAARSRRAPDAPVPTIAELTEQANALDKASRSIEGGWRLSPPSPQGNEQQGLVGWFHELYVALYAPAVFVGSLNHHRTRA